MVKILLTGATGTIGRAVLDRCIAHPNVDTVVAFVRRALPDEIATNSKVQTVIVKDFSVWPEDILTQHLDAAAMIWCLGDWEGQPEVVLDYPLAFQNALINLRRRTADGEQRSFRYVHLSGKLTEQDQSKSLYFFAENRKLKGVHEMKAVELAQEYRPWWQLHLIRPGAVLPNDGWTAGLQELIMGPSWVVRAKELGAYMVHLALGAKETQTVAINERIVQMGRSLLADTDVL
ncbi:hypothetical protein S40285_07665 [Stachybotrys chlorohalonatus IBT 40285]|uniref:NAD(P)-binding domain-containing protein n=1 Tax=Stachybotrys chlorohalonatus (strain IBT 40285) TaxID=1283841 RepID=A0A084Q8N9_STAC4|nr:hypothetical protein S40285_07665 [Stachybotrys chlorohalonata IBT 40285]